MKWNIIIVINCIFLIMIYSCNHRFKQHFPKINGCTDTYITDTKAKSVKRTYFESLLNILNVCSNETTYIMTAVTQQQPQSLSAEAEDEHRSAPSSVGLVLAATLEALFLQSARKTTI